MNPMLVKKIRKVLFIVCGVMVAAAAVIFLIRFIGTKLDNKKLEEKKNELKYSYSSYEFNSSGPVTPSEVNPVGYIPLKQLGDFFIADNALMLEQSLELTYNASIDYGYYIDNRCYSYEPGDGYHYAFFGKDKTSLPFYLKISNEWDKAEWYVKPDFTPPSASVSRVEKILLVSRDSSSKLLSNSLRNHDLRRIDERDAIVITDESKIHDYVNRYKDGVYVFNETFEDIATAKSASSCGYILAAFENSNIYQCIGTY